MAGCRSTALRVPLEGMLRVDQVHVVRHKVLVEGRSQRQVAKEIGIARDTVQKYLTESIPIRKEMQPRPRPAWEAVRARVETLLAESVRWTGGKQRLTATRLHELLVAEGKQVGVTLVKEAVAEWKRQRREVFVPLTYRPGELAEVDFFEVLVDVDGTRRKAWLFLLRLMYSGRDFAWIYERQDQVSFLDGHVRAFAHVGRRAGATGLRLCGAAHNRSSVPTLDMCRRPRARAFSTGGPRGTGHITIQREASHASSAWSSRQTGVRRGESESVVGGSHKRRAASFTRVLISA